MDILKTCRALSLSEAVNGEWSMANSEIVFYFVTGLKLGYL
jgi:hypothetical protein